jgi:hypothetical protein
MTPSKSALDVPPSERMEVNVRSLLNSHAS